MQPRRSLLAIGSIISLLFGLWLWSGGNSLDRAITPQVSASAVATSASVGSPQYKTVAIQDVVVGQQVTVSVPDGSELPDTRLDSDPSKGSLLEPTSSDLTTYEYPADKFVAAAIRIGVQNGTIVSAESDDAAVDAATLIGTRYMVGDTDATDVNRLLCRTVVLEMRKPDGSIADLSVIRPLWWMAGTGATEGGTIDLALHEIGLSGDARVLTIRACDVDSRDTSSGMNIITGTIQHRNAVVWDLTFDGRSDETLGITANHPLYSQTRRAWVSAGDLQLDEIVQTLNGEATLTARSERHNRETVFNMEVHRTHAYHVSGLGVLAHNTRLPCPPADRPRVIGREVIEQPNVSKFLDDLPKNQRKAADQLLDDLAHDRPGRNQHALTGDRIGQWAADLPGGGAGRGGRRLIFRHLDDGSILLEEIITGHKY